MPEAMCSGDMVGCLVYTVIFGAASREVTAERLRMWPRVALRVERDSS